MQQPGPHSILFDDQLLNNVYQQIGQVYMDRRRWKRAARYFVLCKQTDKLADCLFQLEQYDALQDLQQHLHDSSPVHKQLAGMYESIGMCALAAESYVKVMPRALTAVPLIAWRCEEHHTSCQKHDTCTIACVACGNRILPCAAQNPLKSCD